MDLRVAVCIFVLIASTSAAVAQRELPRRFPAEKFSPQPVQPKQSSKPAQMPIVSDKDQKVRWEERSRGPSEPPR